MPPGIELEYDGSYDAMFCYKAKNYALLLDLPFAYATNGKGIVEDDRDTGFENDKLKAFPTPDEL